MDWLIFAEFDGLFRVICLEMNFNHISTLLEKISKNFYVNYEEEMKSLLTKIQYWQKSKIIGHNFWI